MRLLLILVLWAALAAPAAAKLDDTVLTFKQSALIKGDTLFKYDGRVGARYRFSGATRCMFGNGLLYLDTQDGTIVQETVILPLPNHPRERARLEKVVQMFLKETGLEKEDADQVYAAFEDGIQAGKSSKKDLGGFNPLKRKYEYNVYCNPALRSVLVQVALKQ
ncbi:MAG: hypothetical protein JWM80_2747 [Cyanobacteria bacterium RYN_339]|nr:hypothetical protein [Cyanobacteria bacterium RYN_339]